MGYGFNKKGGLTTKGVGKLLTFNGNRPVTRQGIPGLTGVVLGGDDILKWGEGFYPALAPGALLTGGNTRQFGASPAVNLSWTATKQTNPITQISVAGTYIVPTGNTQSGVLAVMATQNVNTTFSMLVKTAGEQATASTTVVWSHKRFWGTIIKDGINQPILDADIIRLNQEFSTTRTKTLAGFDGGGKYFIYVFPTGFGAPEFLVNGLPNTAFTKVRTGAFVNSDDFSSSFDVWMSNTIVSGLANYQIN